VDQHATMVMVPMDAFDKTLVINSVTYPILPIMQMFAVGMCVTHVSTAAARINRRVRKIGSIRTALFH
jgi:hypothetical protein